MLYLEHWNYDARFGVMYLEFHRFLDCMGFLSQKFYKKGHMFIMLEMTICAKGWERRRFVKGTLEGRDENKTVKCGKIFFANRIFVVRQVLIPN